MDIKETNEQYKCECERIGQTDPFLGGGGGLA